MTTLTPGTILGQAVRVFDLEQPRFQGMPVHEAHAPGYVYSLHRRHADAIAAGIIGPRASASGVLFCMEHSGTHLDALCHQSENQLMYGGIEASAASTAKGFTRLGVDEVPPIVARGVLLDVARFRGVNSLHSGDVVPAEELQACAAAQDLSISSGDVVLVRTGIGHAWHDSTVFLPGPGMDGSAARWMAELQVAAVGADNMAWDAIGLFDEELGCELPAHIHLLVRAGIHIIENLYLEELAAAKVSDFSFICAPLKLTGATGSPVRPIAIVPATQKPV